VVDRELIARSQNASHNRETRLVEPPSEIVSSFQIQVTQK